MCQLGGYLCQNKGMNKLNGLQNPKFNLTELIPLHISPIYSYFIEPLLTWLNEPIF